MNIVMLMMGGNGSRTGKNIPKQYITMRGKPIFSYILEEYARQTFIDSIVIVSHEKWIRFVADWNKQASIPKVHAVVAGGKNRSESVYNGLKACRSIASDDTVILIHDATHPYLDVNGTVEVINQTLANGAATMGAFSYDTVYRIDKNNSVAEVLPRTQVISGASPEAFIFGLIFPVYANSTEDELASMTSAGAIALKNNIKMAFVKTNLMNLKITFPHDLKLFETLFEYYYQHIDI